MACLSFRYAWINAARAKVLSAVLAALEGLEDRAAGPVTTPWRVGLRSAVVDSWWFDRGVLVLIVANTVTLMWDRWPMAHAEQYVLCQSTLLETPMLIQITENLDACLCSHALITAL